MFKKKKDKRPDELAAIVYATDTQEALEKLKQKYRLTPDSFGGFAACFPKKKFNIDEWRGKYVMHCENKDELFKFYDYLHSVGRKLITGRDYVELKATLDAVGKPIKYIFFNEGMYAGYMDKAYASEYTVLNFKDFDWSDFNMKETKFKIGDKVRVVRANLGDKFKYIGDIFTINKINPNAPFKCEEHYGVEDNSCRWVFDVNELELVEEKPFTKADLKTGMVVEHKDGDRFMVIGDHLVSDDCCHKLSEYKDDLTPVVPYLPCAEIVAVYIIKADELDDISDVFANTCLATIWRRNEVKEMTVAEIEEKLGYKVKVIADKE